MSEAEVIRHYESGANLASLRGHAKTPERPALATPDRYPEYFSARRTGRPMKMIAAPDSEAAAIANGTGGHDPDGDFYVNGLAGAERSMVGKHLNAVDDYLRNGDASVLDPFRGKRVNGVEFDTNTRRLRNRDLRGELSLDNVYPNVEGPS